MSSDLSEVSYKKSFFVKSEIDNSMLLETKGLLLHAEGELLYVMIICPSAPPGYYSL